MKLPDLLQAVLEARLYSCKWNRWLLMRLSLLTQLTEPCSTALMTWLSAWSSFLAWIMVNNQYHSVLSHADTGQNCTEIQGRGGHWRSCEEDHNADMSLCHNARKSMKSKWTIPNLNSPQQLWVATGKALDQIVQRGNWCKLVQILGTWIAVESQRSKPDLIVHSNIADEHRCVRDRSMSWHISKTKKTW
jgi:hypothetical protein